MFESALVGVAVAPLGVHTSLMWSASCSSLVRSALVREASHSEIKNIFVRLRSAAKLFLRSLSFRLLFCWKRATSAGSNPSKRLRLRSVIGFPVVVVVVVRRPELNGGNYVVF